MDEFKIIDFGAKQLPVRMHDEDAGLDIFAPYDFTVRPHRCVVVELGFGVLLPPGYQASTKPRGSRGTKGLIPVDNPIDSNYRGMAHAVVWNVSENSITVREGERFCQLVVTPCVLGDWPVIKPTDAPESDRGTDGYGSTD